MPTIEVRMDSKLVVEQMSGRWKIKHPDMKPLAMEANRLAPFGTTYTWVPREQNKHADRLANEALDGMRDGVTAAGAAPVDEPHTESAVDEAESQPPRPTLGLAPPGPATTLILVRHGVTLHTVAKRFSGGLASSNPGLSDEGRDQIRATADWLAPIAEGVDAVIASPVRRTLESAEIVAETLGPSRRDRARLRGDGVRRLGRHDVRRGGREAQGGPRLVDGHHRRRRRRR